MATEGTELTPTKDIVEEHKVLEEVNGQEDTDSDSDDPTGLPDLENLVRRMEQGETFSDPGSEDYPVSEEEVDIAEHAYDCLRVVIDREGNSVGNGIMVLRTTDKVFEAWNNLLKVNNFDKDAYKAAALRAVDATDETHWDSVYNQTGDAFVQMINVAECSMAGLSEIKSGVESMRRQIRDAIEFERLQKGKAKVVLNMTNNLIAIEHERGMLTTNDDVSLSVATDTLYTTRASGKGRGNRTNHPSTGWTDEERLELLKIYRDNPKASNKERANTFNERFPNSNRTKEAIRQKHIYLIKAGTKIEELEANVEQ